MTINIFSGLSESNLFIIFAFGFLLGLCIGIAAGMWQKEQDELKEFKKQHDL